MRTWLKDTWKEATVLSKKVLKVKDVFIAVQFIAITIGAISHLKTCSRLDDDDKKIVKVTHQRDSVSLKVDSCKAVIINQKYGN